MQPHAISHYEILAPLGEGGMGVVYQARDTRLDRLVALKFLPPPLIDSASARRLADEARAISSLNHPAIATIYDIAEDGDAPVLVLEYLPGGTLRKRMDTGSLSPAEIAGYAIQAAEGLACAHRHGILHRDIKPENLLFTADGRLKITDFGLARLNDGRTVTRTGSITGTLTHVAPECLQGLALDHRADIFSLGVVLYEMAAGKPPFQGDNAAAVMYAVVHEEPPQLTGPFSHIVRRALAKDRERRYQTAQELADDLRAPAASRAPPSPPRAQHCPTILVIEDEDDLRRGIELNLTREGFRVMTAANGPEGVRTVVSQTPDLVLLDVMLPGRSGLDVCRDLRSAGFAAPILMLSARSEEIDRVVGLEIGADDYVTKPFSMRELVARVRAHLRVSR
jgi:serine/threonine protein kinase